MNIGIDARLLERKMTGIGRVLSTMLDELPRVDKHNKYFLFSYDDFEIDKDFYSVVPTGKSSIPQKLFAPIWSNFILPGYLKKHNIDLFFSVNQQIPLVKVKGIKYIFVLHDVIYQVDKSFHPFVYRKYLQFFSYFSIKSSDLIITDSHYSKSDILKYYKNVEENRIKVVYPAIDKEFKVMDLPEEEKSAIRKKLNLPDRIVFYVGMIENRKNIKGILEIADEVYKKHKDIKFVFVGKIGYGGEELLGEIEKKENAVHLKNVDDQLLKQLYNISAVFLFPSFYEGFGYPPLEAMQCGLPVISSNNTSLKEILNGGALMHEASDNEAFINDLFRLLDDRDFYEETRRKGLQRAQKFNIHSTVNELVQVFNSMKNNQQ